MEESRSYFIDRRSVPSRSSRLLAGVIDRLVVLIIAGFVVQRLNIVSAHDLAIPLLVSALLTWILYKGIMESSFCWGQTIGRAIQHVRVVHETGNFLTLRESIYRASLEALLFLVPPLFLIDAAFWLVDGMERRSLLDRLSDSVVMEAEPGDSRLRVRLAAVAVVWVVFFGFYEMWKVKPGTPVVTENQVAGGFLGEVQSAAADGDSISQLMLGMAYFTGKELPQDFKEAAKWFKRAAGQGNARAKYHLAALYAAGKGVPRDFSMALSLLRSAADSGDTDAQDMLRKIASAKP